MTRWARANNVHKQKPAEATPWSQLKARRGGAGKHDSSGSSAYNKQKPQNDHLRRTQPGGSAVKKPNRKKKEYADEDVNGFLEYLQQTGQSLPKGEKRGSVEETQFKEELETALKKDRRREDRRLKRQNVKKKNMVNAHFRYSSSIVVLCRPTLTEWPPSLFLSCVLTAGSLAMAWQTVQRPTETRRWAEASATGVAPQNMKSRNAKLKWTLLWVSAGLRPTRRNYFYIICWCQNSVPAGEFPYAKCFICGETGHLSRTCPDNPKGLYAQGIKTLTYIFLV